jgi:hypothetical protein
MKELYKLNIIMAIVYQLAAISFLFLAILERREF